MSSSSTTSNNAGAHWSIKLRVKELQQLLRARDIPEERGCVERSRLAALVEYTFPSREEATKLLAELNQNADDTKKPAINSKMLFAQIEVLLAEDRTVLSYTNYTPSASHLQRMHCLGATHAYIFQNPQVTPRFMWFSHPHWHLKEQMPQYHVHFRLELQEALRSLCDCYYSFSWKAQYHAAQNAHQYLDAMAQGLRGHASIEENYLFPDYHVKFPNIDLSFLYHDHKRLHQVERAAKRRLRNLLERIQAIFDRTRVVPRDEILPVLEALFTLDRELVAHLGEEEEVIVPLTLSE
jgi:hypothetical protein